ncbi:MAG: hypothetical protein U1F43_39200, partial [Myxococcota bacterium]
ANRIEARIEAARVAALARSADSRTAIIVDALKTIAAELAPLAPPTQRPKLEAVSADLDRLTPAPPPSTFPALIALAPHLRGVSVRRDEHRLTVTSELDDEGLPALFGYLKNGR